MEPVKLSQLSKTSIRKIVHSDNSKPKDEVLCWNLFSNDRLVYVEALSGEVCVYLPDKFDPHSTLIIKRVYTSNHNVYVKTTNDAKIEGEEGAVLDDEVDTLTFRIFDNGWHVF